MALFDSIQDDFRHILRNGNMVTKIVLVNFSVFVLVSIAYVALWIGLRGAGHYEALWVGLDYLCMPADWKELLWHPWTPITSIFLHQSFWHILSNMIWLFLFGNIVGDLIRHTHISCVTTAGVTRTKRIVARPAHHLNGIIYIFS